MTTARAFRPIPLAVFVALFAGCRGGESSAPVDATPVDAARTAEARTARSQDAVDGDASPNPSTSATASTSDAASASALPPWPADAPSSDACNVDGDCVVSGWGGVPWPPNPCCDRPLPFVPVSRKYLEFTQKYRAARCSGVVCPALPLPGPEPAACAYDAKCVAQRCVRAGCKDGGTP